MASSSTTYKPGGPPVHADITTQPGSRLSVPWIQWFNQTYGLSNAADDASTVAGVADDKANTALALINSLANDAAVNAGTADNKATQALSTLARIADALDYLTQAPPVVRPKAGLFGSFFDTTTQTTAINTPAVLTLNTTDIGLGVYRGATTSRVYVTDAGIYNMQFSVQLANSGASVDDVNIWLRLNGTDVAGSNGLVSVPAKHGGFDGHVLVGWNFFLSLAANDYFEVVWCPSSASITIPYIAASAGPPAIPATYSVVLTVTQANVSIPA